MIRGFGCSTDSAVDVVLCGQVKSAPNPIVEVVGRNL